MSKNIYQKYIDNINDSLKYGKKRGEFQKSFINENLSGFDGKETTYNSLNQVNDEVLFESLQQLNDITGQKAKYHQKLGAHPDFIHIKTNNTVDYHYIASVFIDIKNSTGLFKNYYPITVENITSTIQKAAIHTCWYFDGYVQRLHGDGLLAYFGGKGITKEKAVKNALNAASFISYFVKNDLKNLFNEQGIENIYTRIGIDLGDDDDVLWHLAGMGECSEITTCSLHTSLASKMQANASNNGVMVGDKVRNISNVTDDFFIRKNYTNDGNEYKYIYQNPDENFYYSQWVFNWEKYLKQHPSIVSDENGNLYFKPKQTPLTAPLIPNIDALKRTAAVASPWCQKK